MKIREKITIHPERGYRVFRYFARFGRQWVDLAPFGNCVERAREALAQGA